MCLNLRPPCTPLKRYGQTSIHFPHPSVALGMGRPYLFSFYHTTFTDTLYLLPPRFPFSSPSQTPYFTSFTDSSPLQTPYPYLLCRHPILTFFTDTSPFPTPYPHLPYIHLSLPDTLSSSSLQSHLPYRHPILTSLTDTSPSHTPYLTSLTVTSPSHTLSPLKKQTPSPLQKQTPSPLEKADPFTL